MQLAQRPSEDVSKPEQRICKSQRAGKGHVERKPVQLERRAGEHAKEEDAGSTDLDEEGTNCFRRSQGDVLVQDRSRELNHPKRDEAELGDCRLVCLLANGEKSLPREAMRGGGVSLRAG